MSNQENRGDGRANRIPNYAIFVFPMHLYEQVCCPGESLFFSSSSQVSFLVRHRRIFFWKIDSTNVASSWHRAISYLTHLHSSIVQHDTVHLLDGFQFPNKTCTQTGNVNFRWLKRHLCVRSRTLDLTLVSSSIASLHASIILCANMFRDSFTAYV